MSQIESRTAELRALARTDEAAATAKLADLLRDLFNIEASDIRFNHDQYSLNSLNGFFETGEGPFFFKFHQEDGEEAMSGEYYRADILAKAGLPVDQPVYMSALPGEQILIYHRRNDPRFSDVLRALDLQPDAKAEALALAAETDLSAALLKVYRETLHPITPADAAAEPIHRLFHERMIDPATGVAPGGRYKSFYIGQSFAFPGADLSWDDVSTRHFVINGIRYENTIGALFEMALDRLNPQKMADAGGVTAHGDAHNANVWYAASAHGPELSFFDPAFAGRNVPTLLAEVKSTFHNILAHPLWLYDPADATARYSATLRLEPGLLIVNTDWSPSRVRLGLLDIKARHLWAPLLADLQARNMLPADWRRVIRLALFLCPTLVMNLRAEATTHTRISSLIGFSVAVMAGSEPRDGEDPMSRFFDTIDPDRAAFTA